MWEKTQCGSRDAHGHDTHTHKVNKVNHNKELRQLCLARPLSIFSSFARHLNFISNKRERRKKGPFSPPTPVQLPFLHLLARGALRFEKKKSRGMLGCLIPRALFYLSPKSKWPFFFFFSRCSYASHLQASGLRTCLFCVSPPFPFFCFHLVFLTAPLFSVTQGDGQNGLGCVYCMYLHVCMSHVCTSYVYVYIRQARQCLTPSRQCN